MSSQSSSYEGYLYVEPGTHFYNMVGTGYDPRPFNSSSFISLWKTVAKTADFIYGTNVCEFDRCVAIADGTQCSYELEGAHILFQPIPQNATYGYILPLCRNHNQYDGWMTSNSLTIAVWLDNINRQIHQ